MAEISCMAISDRTSVDWFLVEIGWCCLIKSNSGLDSCSLNYNVFPSPSSDWLGISIADFSWSN